MTRYNTYEDQIQQQMSDLGIHFGKVTFCCEADGCDHTWEGYEIPHIVALMSCGKCGKKHMEESE